jgi:hypothetical protein
MMELVPPKPPLYNLTATVFRGKITCDTCGHVVSVNSPLPWKSMDAHMETHTSSVGTRK